ncbi:MAG: GAF domain-containing protein [Pseudomonadales bacterium]
MQATPSDLERTRLRHLDAYAIMDTPSEPAFQALVDQAQQTFGAAAAMMTLIGADRQWLKAQAGTVEIRQTAQAVSFCASAIQNDNVFVVEDASTHPVFKHNPMVAGAPHLRFYAGAPLTVNPEIRLGTLCFVSQEPGSLSDEHRQALGTLRDAVVTQLQLRLQQRNQLTSVCAWCERVQTQTVAPRQVSAELPLTHGICDDCAREIRGEF